MSCAQQFYLSVIFVRIHNNPPYLQGGCQNCDGNLSKLNTALKSNAEKDKYIKELKAMCSKFEKQLTQQDVLLKKVAESQGHKVTIFPK